MYAFGNLLGRGGALIGRITGPAIVDGRDGLFASDEPTKELADVTPPLD